MGITSLKTARTRAVFALIAALAISLSTQVLLAWSLVGPNAGDKLDVLTDTALATHRAHMASELAAFGRESQSAMALIAAAEMLGQAGSRDAEYEATTEGEDTATGDKDSTENRNTVAAMLSDARDLARGDASLLAAVTRVESQESKGRVGGPARKVAIVKGRHKATYTLRFHGGLPAIVSVVGDGDTDLDLKVFDENGNLICSDTDYTDRNYCRWQPRWTGQFRIVVSNHGRVYNRYTIRTN